MSLQEAWEGVMIKMTYINNRTIRAKAGTSDTSAL